MKKIIEKNEYLCAPNSSGNVWPSQNCPVFTPRGGAVEKTCWYCIYADFHLDKPRALDVGICDWPIYQYINLRENNK